MNEENVGEGFDVTDEVDDEDCDEVDELLLA